MFRIDRKIKNRIIRLIKENKSLNKIKEVTGINKTTIYYYMRKIKGRKIKLVNIKKGNLELIGEVIGLFAGDGCFYHDKKRYTRRITFSFNKKEDKIIDYYRNSLTELTNKNPRLYISKSIKTLDLQSKEFSEFILKYLSWDSNKTKTVQIKNKEVFKNKQFVIGFLRGLIDSDGYIRKKRKEIYYGTISKKLLNDFLYCLNLFNFKYKVYIQKGKKYNDFYKVRLTNLEVDRFVDLIRPLKSNYYGRTRI